MPLTDTAIRRASVRAQNYSLNDIQGLSLHVTTSGTKSWHFRYLWHGKQVRISLGVYPTVTLKEARKKCNESHDLITSGIDPRAERRAQQEQNLQVFTEVWKQWSEFRSHRLREGRQTSQTQMKRIFGKDVLPWIGRSTIHEITRTDLIKILRRLEQRKAFSIATKCRSWFNQLFRYAMVEYNLPGNPAADLDIVAEPSPPAMHHPFLRMEELPEFLYCINQSRARPKTILCVKLLLLTGVRTGELRLATREQFDLSKGLWTIPAEHVKQLQRNAKRQNIPPYVVPLSQEACKIVKRLMAMGSSRKKYLVSHATDPAKQMSENTINCAIKRAGYEGKLTGHGLRATLSTALNELEYPKEWIEAQLSHADPNAVRATYNHAQYIEQRHKMMQEWANLMNKFALQTRTYVI
jgi:integrase